MDIHPKKVDTGDFNLWLDAFERCATANGWEETQKLHKLPAYLTGTAAEYYALLPARERETYDSLISSLLRVLIPDVYREYHYNQFYSRIYCPNEDPRLYVMELKNILRKADSELDATAQDALVLRQFLTCLKADLKLTLFQHKPTPTLQDLMDFLLGKRALQHLSERVAMETPSTPKEVSLSRTVADLRISVANFVKDQSLLRESISTKSAQSSPARVERRCGNCNAKAHTCVSCPWPTMCSNCMTWDHLQNDCPRTLLYRGESYPNSFHCFRGGPVPLRSAPVNVENEECPQRSAFE